MAERRSALAHLPASDAAEAAVRLSEARPGSIVQVAAWPGTVDAARSILSDLLRVQLPQAWSGMTAGDGSTVLAIAPGRWLATSEDSGLAARLESALLSDDGAVTDLSHGRAILRLEGSGAAALVQASVALDLDRTLFPPGRVAQTAIHHIDVTIHRRAEDAFDIWVLRSFAEALAEWLLDAGKEIGIRFDNAGPRPH